MNASRRIANLLRIHGPAPEHEVVGWGFDSAEIREAISSGTVHAVGSHMGATIIRTLSA